MKEEFLAAFDEYGDAIFRFAMVKTGNKALSEDFVQETFMRFWQSLRAGKPMQNTRAYLYTIANNLIIDWYRKQKEVSLDAKMEHGFDAHDEHAINATLHAEYTEVLAAIRTLDEHDREVMLLRYVEGYEPREIARLLGLSANAVSVRLNRAVQKIQKHMRV